MSDPRKYPTQLFIVEDDGRRTIITEQMPAGTVYSAPAMEAIKQEWLATKRVMPSRRVTHILGEFAP
jgi:hypothetical protein